MNRILATLLSLFAMCSMVGCASLDPTKAAESNLIRVQSVEVIASPGGPVVVLNIPNKSIPVFVDVMVGMSIQAALSGQGPVRPLSHDLMQSILEGLDAKPTQVVITLKEGTYRAALTITSGFRRLLFDSRASDAIALAVRFRVPILIHRDAIDAGSVQQEERPPPI
jgi:bifunctional DNase/RNase